MGQMGSQELVDPVSGVFIADLKRDVLGYRLNKSAGGRAIGHDEC
jgi:hypothetical protein